MLSFASGDVVVYKPRDLAPEAAFATVARWLADRAAPAGPRPLAVVERDGYGWMEFARANPAAPGMRWPSSTEVRAPCSASRMCCAPPTATTRTSSRAGPGPPWWTPRRCCTPFPRRRPPDRCGPTGPGRPQRLGLRHRDAAGLAPAGRRPRLRQQRPWGRGPAAGRARTGPGDQGAGERPAPGREAGGCGRPCSRHRPRVHCHVPRRAGPPHPPGRPGRAAGRGSARPRCGSCFGRPSSTAT